MKQYTKPLSLRNVQVNDKFWKEKMELVRKEVIPYQWDALNDKVEGAAPSFCMRNFKVAGKITKARRELGDKYQDKVWPLDTFETLPQDMEHLEDRFYGFLFQDSDFSKWIEAVAYSLTQHPDEELERIADGAIDIVCAAQQDNGYLDTYYIINDMSKVFTNLRDNHELYCFGHLTEGAVAYYEATGKDKLLNAARRFADYVYDCFGEEEGKKKGYPGHEIAEMALMRLYDVTGEEKYRRLAEFFINQRGTRPYYFDEEHPEVVKKGHENELRHFYHQAHLPVRVQDEALGHSVRAVYLYSGMADVARVDDDDALYEACLKLWNNITQKKIHKGEVVGLTGLLGSGRSELARVIYGADKNQTGKLFVNGKEAKINAPIDAMNLGMGLLPDDRKAEGIIADLSVRENIILAMQAKRGMFKLLPMSRQNEIADKYIELLQIKTASRETLIGQLSGGNQQKVILARWLATDPEFLILDEPTRGIDVGTKTEIQKLVIELADQGKSLIFISSEIEEMLRTCSKLVVLRDGQEVGEITEELTQGHVMQSIAGGGRNE